MKKVLAMTNEGLGLVVAIVAEGDTPVEVVMTSKEKFIIAYFQEMCGNDEEAKSLVSKVKALCDVIKVTVDPTLKKEDCVIL